MHVQLTALIFCVSILIGCASEPEFKHEILVDPASGISIVDGGVTTVYQRPNYRAYGKLIYERPGQYSFLIQFPHSNWSFRQTTTVMGDEKLKAEVLDMPSFDGISFYQTLHIDLTQNHVGLAMRGRFQAINKRWTGEEIWFNLPAHYTNSFMQKVYEFDPDEKKIQPISEPPL